MRTLFILFMIALIFIFILFSSMYGNNNYNYFEQKPHVEILQIYTEETTIINPKHTSTSTFPKNIRKIQTQYRFGFAMPGYLVEILSYSSELNLIIVDLNFLKCYAHNEFCMNLFNHPSFHMASTHNKMDLLSKFRQILIDKDASWSILPSKDSELVVLNYRYVENFYKNVTISIIDFDDTNKNYFLLKREDGYPTIAVRKFEIQQQNSLSNFPIFLPKDIKRFLKWYENGKFLECNKMLAARMDQNKTKIPIKSIIDLSQFVDHLLDYNQLAWLVYGSLLGWYRHCGFIPHTDDIDLGVLSSEYNDNLIDSLTTHSNFKLAFTIGVKEYSYEIAVWTEFVRIDVFYLSSLNETTYWASVLDHFVWLNRTKSLIPKISGTCTGELYGELFFVPCNFAEILLANFGPNWRKSDEGKLNYTEYHGHGEQNFEDGNWIGPPEKFIKYYYPSFSSDSFK